MIQCKRMGWFAWTSIVPGQSSKGWGQLKAHLCSRDTVPARYNCWLTCGWVQNTCLLGFTACPSNCAVWAKAPHLAQPDGKAMMQEASWPYGFTLWAGSGLQGITSTTPHWKLQVGNHRQKYHTKISRCKHQLGRVLLWLLLLSGCVFRSYPILRDRHTAYCEPSNWLTSLFVAGCLRFTFWYLVCKKKAK